MNCWEHSGITSKFIPDTASQARPEKKDSEEEEEEEEENDDEYDDVEEILLEKRVTFHVLENQNWKVRTVVYHVYCPSQQG